jgi:hypothetical protein
MLADGELTLIVSPFNILKYDELSTALDGGRCIDMSGVVYAVMGLISQRYFSNPHAVKKRIS